MMLILLQAMFLFLPAYFGNMFPVFASALFRKRYNAPVDGGLKWRGKRIAGDHKTWRGLVSAIIGGLLAFYLQRYLVLNFSWWASLAVFDYQAMTPWFGVVLGLFAVLGDLVKSVAKRQLGIAPGKNWIPFDQLDYVVGALIGVLFFFVPSWSLVLWIVVLSFVLHVGAHLIGHKMKDYGNSKA